ncbi:hypothetical protein DU478_20475 [Thalassococcus profundi]|uniref:Uncharacterized protein n=1 Tax=Thalassococcus profundi TaxID=2282382 RepID=A0A369TIB8_9RHOB|nr:hypothetical protein DU478_20475 [Thalassococcus profundi]
MRRPSRTARDGAYRHVPEHHVLQFPTCPRTDRADRDGGVPARPGVPGRADGLARRAKPRQAAPDRGDRRRGVGGSGDAHRRRGRAAGYGHGALRQRDGRRLRLRGGTLGGTGPGRGDGRRRSADRALRPG